MSFCYQMLNKCKMSHKPSAGPLHYGIAFWWESCGGQSRIAYSQMINYMKYTRMFFIYI